MYFTRMIMANFPHNPTGATLTPDEREELLRLTRDMRKSRACRTTATSRVIQ